MPKKKRKEYTHKNHQLAESEYCYEEPESPSFCECGNPVKKGSEYCDSCLSWGKPKKIKGFIEL